MGLIKKGEPERKSGISISRDSLWNGLTIVALLATLAALVVLLMIFNNPVSGVNPYPPPASANNSALPTTTLAASATLTSVTSTDTTADTRFISSETPPAVPSPTVAVVVVEATPAQPDVPPTLEPTNPSGYAFGLMAQPQGIAASLYQPTRGCSWMGVAGRAFDLKNRPVRGIRVQLTGWLNGRSINLLSLTGTALDYGPSGYEFSLADAPIATTGWLKIQLLDQSDLPLSSIIVLDTYAECEKNLVLVDFKQINE